MTTGESSKSPGPAKALNWAFARRLWALLKLLFPAFLNDSTWLLLFVLIVSVINQVVAYYIGILPSEFYRVMGHRELGGFRLLCGKSLLLVAAKALSLASINYSSASLYLHWRSLLGRQLHALYFRPRTLFRLNSPSAELDNPDQRLTQDVEKTTNVLATKIVAQLILSPGIIGYYTYKTFETSGWVGPPVTYAFFVIVTVVNKVLLAPLVRLVAAQEAKEGNFRFKHVSVRANAEEISFYGAEATEEVLANRRLNSLIATQTSLILRQFFVKVSTTFCDYFGGPLTYFIIAVPIFVYRAYDGVDPVDLTAIISQNSFFTMYLINAFTNVIDVTGNLGVLAGTTHRVMELVESMRRDVDHKDEELAKVSTDGRARSPTSLLVAAEGRPGSPDSDVSLPDAPADPDLFFRLSNVTLRVPGSDADERPLIRELNLDIGPGTELLITGPSSSGKTSLLRLLAGIWEPSEGSVSRLGEASSVMFLPQRAYLPDGCVTLRQSLLYPHLPNGGPRPAAAAPEDLRLREALKMVELDSLLTRMKGLDGRVAGEWGEWLSPGELQRLSIARALVRRPKLLVLDEATSALGFALESSLYRRLQECGMGLLSVGHRLSLRQFHSTELHLAGDGSWSLSHIDRSQANSLMSSLTSLNL